MKNIQKKTIGNFPGAKSRAYKKVHRLVKTRILGVDITNDSKENILEYIIDSLENSQKPYYIVTPNPEIIVFSSQNPEFKKVLNDAEIALCDGIGVLWSGAILGKSLKQRFTGVELLEKLCEKVANRPITVGFLGGGVKIAEKVSERLKQKYKGLQVGYVSQEFEDSQKVGVDILFIAFGFPKQEIWMADHIGKMDAKVMVGVGGAFDQLVRPTLRPPKVLDSMGIGWLYRLVRQPWRFKRQLALLTFIKLVLHSRLHK